MRIKAYITFASLIAILISNLSNAQSLVVPSLLSPANNAINASANELLDWSSSTGANAYQYRIGISSNLNNTPAVQVTASQASLANLLFGTVYYWQVRAIKTTSPTDSSNWSSVSSFTTLDQIFLVAPTNGALSQAPNEVLDWSILSGITNYDYQWDTTVNFNSPLLTSASIASGTSQVTTSNLRFGTRYFWRVRGRHTADTTQWSVVRSFTTIDQIFLVAPTNGALSQAPNELLDWSLLSGITNYDYQWDTSANFNSPLLTSASIASGISQVTTSNLRFGTTYFWRVRGRHSVDTTQWSAVRSFTTIDQIFLVAPTNGAMSQAPNELLDWSLLSGITNYDYQWDTTSNFNSPLLTSASIASGTSQVTTSNLRFGTTYFWRVRGRHSVDTTQWSAVRFFTTTDQIFLVAPTNGALSQAPNELLDWSLLSGITNYDYQWDSTANFNSPLLNSASIASGTSQVTTSNLRFGTTYFWRVRGRHSADTTQWSAVRFFTTTDQIFLVSPANGATNVATNPVLDWSILSGITAYQYQLDTLFSFGTSSIQTIGSASSQVSTSGLLSGRIYYWRVRAYHAADTSNWSVVRSFGVNVSSIVAPLFTQVGPFCSGDIIASLPSTSLNGVNGTWSPAINNTASTTYTFIPNAGQSATATTLTINIKQPSTSTDIKSACISYQWINGITYTQSTNSPTFVLTNAAGCDSVVTLNLTISPLNIDVQPLSETVVENSEVIFTVNSNTLGATYQWQTDTGNGFVNITNGGQYSGSTNDTLIVSAITSNNDNQLFRCVVSTASCSSTSDVATLFVEVVLGMDALTNNVSIYPNPTSDQIIIKANSELIGNNYQVYNSTGKLILSGKIHSDLQMISLKEFPLGIYLFTIENNLNKSFKILKN